MKYLLVDMPPVGANEYDDIDAFVAACDVAGYTRTGTTDMSAKYAEMRGQPTFRELHGPMGGNANRVRYETWPASEMYSR